MTKQSSPKPHNPVDPEITQIHALSFGQAADLYDTARPTYPTEALRWGFGDNPIDIVDVGAGTGLLTRGLIAMGHRVTVVEPDRQMLDKLIAVTRGLTAHHHGNAEALPLPDAYADAVTAGQAYHWFDPDRALPQIKRVLRPGGHFVPMWNVRDESVDWVKRLSDIVGSSAAELTAGLASAPGYFAPYFDDPELKLFRHEKPLTPEGLVRLVKSRSYYLTASLQRQKEIMAGVSDLLANHPLLAGRDEFAMPYLTHVFRLRRG
ncbi:methyltransferase family protein [Stackebrandtia endophytica]|uniref:Methyltransferase family protein n=1 Tax=Stackebrandtia endophytica TaxID=1496996 RepID=A0A543AYU6_9ACTN|nr:class I SAM-dependent methyltransferase [Stackebrandtia endophytica]TQL77752.1 methyltransferase family protein [Stackebrandtia endophytica]